MSLYITIDGGTTNTRLSLVKDRELIDNIKLNIGVRSNLESNEQYKNEIKSAIKKLLKDNNLKENDIISILASGMITSEFGLCSLEHISTPAGLSELHNSMEKVQLKEITEIPFVFLRGVKTVAESFENVDIMRGEETELFGIINSDYGKCVYILPGSHSKIIKVDDSGKITDFSTMLTGEMIASLSQNTILKDAVDLSVSDINSEYLLKGYDYCVSEGINKSLFKTRILKNIFNCTKEETYSFFLGTVLCSEIMQIINCDVRTVVIGGRVQIKNAMAEILSKRCEKKIVSLSETEVNLSTSKGAVCIFEGKY